MHNKFLMILTLLLSPIYSHAIQYSQEKELNVSLNEEDPQEISKSSIESQSEDNQRVTHDTMLHLTTFIDSKNFQTATLEFYHNALVAAQLSHEKLAKLQLLVAALSNAYPTLLLEHLNNEYLTDDARGHLSIYLSARIEKQTVCLKKIVLLLGASAAAMENKSPATFSALIEAYQTQLATAVDESDMPDSEKNKIKAIIQNCTSHGYAPHDVKSILYTALIIEQLHELFQEALDEILEQGTK